MLKIAQYALWLALPPLQLAIVYRIYRRQRYREYSLFLAYTLEQLVRFTILFYCHQRKLDVAYSNAFAVLQVIEAVLQIGIVCELFSNVLDPYEGIRQIGPALLKWASIFFLLLAIVLALYSTSGDSYKFLAWLYAMSRSVEIVQGGLLLSIAIASSLLALQWKPTTMLIAIGFGLFTSVNVVTYTLRYQWGIASEQILSLVSNAGYLLAVLIWTYAFYAKPQVVAEAGRQSTYWDVQSWNKALSQMLRRQI